MHDTVIKSNAVLALTLALCAHHTRDARADKPSVDPYVVIVGGVGVESLQAREGDTNEARNTTIALSRLGMRGVVATGIYVESEFEVNAGPHGTSVWEGQAAMQVRNQLLRIERGKARVEVGRITDDSSLDFFSAHVADQLLTDPFTRFPLLSSGFNRGNGVLARYEVIPGLRPGLTLNAANPTSTTSSLVLGGSFAPFSRFYFAPYQHVGRDASSLPADQYHITVLTPSVVYQRNNVEAHGAVQMFRVNTDTSSTDDQNILGYNLRAGVKVKTMEGKLTPFANVSRVSNSVVDPNDGKMLSTDTFEGVTFSMGTDYAINDKAGVGAQWAIVRGQQGKTHRDTSHYINAGATYWLADTTSVGARAAVWTRCEEIAGESPCDREGIRAFFMTARSMF